MIWQHWMKRGILAEMGAQLNSLSTTPQWLRTPRGLWSGLNFLGASLYLPWDLLGPFEAGAGPPALPPWTARTCQRCSTPWCWWGDGGDDDHMKVICIPHPRLASLFLAPFACERRRYPAGSEAAPAPVCSSRRSASSGRAASRLSR